MQHRLSTVSNEAQHLDSSSAHNSVVQHGLQHFDAGDQSRPDLLLHQQHPQLAPAHDAHVRDDEGVDAVLLGDRLRRLSQAQDLPVNRPKVLGQRISEYEKAATPSAPRHLLFQVTKCPGAPSAGFFLSDLPNEILTQILSHLHPDSHASVALVSRRFYSLVTSPHAWRMAFERAFPGQDVAVTTPTANKTWQDEEDSLVRAEIHDFTRLALQSSWRSEFSMRTRLLRSLARGKPGASTGSTSRSSQTTRKGSAILTYHTKLPSRVTNIHASFASSGKKSPRVIHGTSESCVSSASDPTIGLVEKWGLNDDFTFVQLDQAMEGLRPYGLDGGPAAVPNVMDVSQPYGIIGGEGFPGGRVYYRPSDELRGRYLDDISASSDNSGDIPKIPELLQGVSSVWIAKSSAVPLATNAMIAMMAGSTLGVVTAYASYDPSGPRYTHGEMSTRWVLSPGVPIIALAVDDNYSLRRKSSHRVFAVALNAFGEVFYLTQPPALPSNKTRGCDTKRFAWAAGRSTQWHLIESTRRKALPDENGDIQVQNTVFPRSSSDALGLDADQMTAEARQIEQFMHHDPEHFQNMCPGWDMRRRLEVDFTSENDTGSGESVLVLCRGLERGEPFSITRLCRSSAASSNDTTKTGSQPLVTARMILDDWQSTSFIAPPLAIKEYMTTSVIDRSLVAVATLHEEASRGSATPSGLPAASEYQSLCEVPGRRARSVAIGTSTGRVFMWNMRQLHNDAGVQPVRVISTDSPKITALALTSLYLVHGGSDGLVQAWDPLASSLEPIRTLNSRSIARLTRQTATQAPGQSQYYSVGAIFLDPDSTVLRGIVSFGPFVRFWSYSSSGQMSRRKRRGRHSTMHGAERRNGGDIDRYIADVEKELRDEEESEDRENARLKARFGVGFADLNEAETLQVAEIMSRESLLLEEQRRTSASDTASTVDCDTTSTYGSRETVTPDPSMTGRNASGAGSSNDAHIIKGVEDDDELQIQTALRLSLLESSGNDAGQSQPDHSPDNVEYTIVYKDSKGKGPAWPRYMPSGSHTPSSPRWAAVANQSSSPAPAPTTDDNTNSNSGTEQEDEELQLALKLSLAEEEERRRRESLAGVTLSYISEDDFPPLGAPVLSKGKGRAVW